MLTADFVCPKGHVTERFFHLAARRTKTTKCARCRRRARFVPGLNVPRARAEVFEYVSPTYGVPIRSRRQLEALDRRHGNAPLEYLKETPAAQFSRKHPNWMRARG